MQQYVRLSIHTPIDASTSFALPLETPPLSTKHKNETETSLGPAAGGQAKIIVVAKESDHTLVELERLPKGSSAVLFRGTTIEEFSTPEGKQALAEANVLLNCVGKRADFPLSEGAGIVV